MEILKNCKLGWNGEILTPYYQVFRQGVQMVEEEESLVKKNKLIEELLYITGLISVKDIQLECMRELRQRGYTKMTADDIDMHEEEDEPEDLDEEM